MMTNREAIKELKNLAIDEYCICSGETCFECENKCESGDAIEMAINTLQECRWIPVTENLPSEDDCYVLVSFENFNMPMIARYTVDEDGGSAFYIGDEDETFAQHNLFVNAWRRLPECYKEEC